MGTPRVAKSPQRPLVRIDPAGRVQVYIHLRCPPDHTLAQGLQNIGVEIERIRTQRVAIIQGWVSPSRLDQLAALPCVQRITPPSYAYPRTGSVTTEGDTILKANLVRAAPPTGFGINGAGIKIGVISDGVAGLATAQGRGDLPGVTVLNAGSGAEGTAMLEIIHDLAPGAPLGFHGVATSLEMCDAIDALRLTFGAKVIVDDLGFPGEPYFADGMVADCASVAVGSGVTYVSAAGNDAQVHYQGLYVNSGDGLGSHRLSPTNTAYDVFGSDVLVVLQWSDPFGTSANNYDLCFAGESPSICALFNVQQNGDDDPIEWDVFDCSAGCSFQVRNVSAASRTLELFFFGGTLEGVTEHSTTASTATLPCLAWWPLPLWMPVTQDTTLSNRTLPAATPRSSSLFRGRV